MDIIDETTEDGVVRRRFDLTVEGRCVPGLHWWPADATAARPTILVGHGGFQSKEAPNIVALARGLARSHGYATIALDAPGHGARRTEDQIREQEATLQRLRTGGVDDRMRRARDRAVTSDTDGNGQGNGTTTTAGGSSRPPRMVREWRALLDELDADTGSTAYGYWGVSMGCRYGIPLIASEPRIRAAVLGLFGLFPDPGFQATVESITIPLLFLFQRDDELMSVEAGLALWAAFGSKEKTLHVNPGSHVAIPAFERDESSAFYARHLG
jgi:pimeloyl-ACP methyl ester carboxylesterase